MDYQGNSHKKSEKKEKPEKKIEKVVTGEVVSQKPPLRRRFKDIFFGGDFTGVARYVAADVLLPAVRNLIVDASTESIRRMVYGGSTQSHRRMPDMRPRVQYNNPINRSAVDPRARGVNLPDQPPYHTHRREEPNEIIIVSREEADLVVERLIDIVDKYDVASLADLYDLVGLPSTHTDNKWGWTYLNNITVRQVRNGYLIDLPPLEAI